MEKLGTADQVFNMNCTEINVAYYGHGVISIRGNS